MSLTIRCPSCDQPLQVAPQHVGKNVRCPSCKATIKVPPIGLTPLGGQAPPPPPPSPPPPPPPSFPQPDAAGPATDYVDSGSSGDLNLSVGGGSSRRGGSRLPRGMTASSSILDIFDFSFKRYVTPLIVKVTWILTLVMAFIWLASLSFWFVYGLVGSSGGATASASSGFPTGRSSRMPPSMDFEPRSVELPSSALLSVLRIVSYLTMLLGAVVGILWVRAVLEGIIVIFHIAETLVDIRSYVSRDGP